MGYSTLADIQGEFKNIEFTSTTNVTDTTVNGFIAEADALINSYVGAKYFTPVTQNQDALDLLKLCSRTIVAARVRSIIAVKQATNMDANQEGRGAVGFTVANAMAVLKDIRDGKTNLPGAELLVASGSLSSYNQANGIEPIFRKNEKQW